MPSGPPMRAQVCAQSLRMRTPPRVPWIPACARRGKNILFYVIMCMHACVCVCVCVCVDENDNVRITKFGLARRGYLGVFCFCDMWVSERVCDSACVSVWMRTLLREPPSCITCPLRKM